MNRNNLQNVVAASLCRVGLAFLLPPGRRHGVLATTASKARPTHQAFTLTELLVSVFVLVIIVFMGAQMISSTTAVTRPSNKHISTDTQARAVLDRIALDFAQMLKRTDVDYYVKGPTNYTGHGNGHAWGKRLQTGQQGSDQVAFFTQVPGYYPSSAGQSPFSLVAYRVNQGAITNNPAYMRLERLGKGLRSNGNDPGTNPGISASFPIVFLPQTISGVGKPWAAAINNNSNCFTNNTNNSCDTSYEVIGPGVFRFEYYYILKNGQATDVPWDRFLRPNQTSLTSPVQIGLTDVESIVTVIAVMDSASRALMDASASSPGNASMLDLVSDLADFASSPGRGVGNQTRYIGEVEASWETTIETWASTGYTSIPSYIPPAVASGIRVYGRSFDLKTLSNL
jgi:hypothetical protein